MQSQIAITVYCSSSKHVAPVYFQAAGELGRAIALEKWTLVYGGNCVGTMAALADSARAHGGKVIGITPRLLVEKGIADAKCDELITTETMRQRKELMEARGDAFVALPGGIGTFEEVFEIIVGRHLGYHSKPIVLLNVANYYGPLLEMLEHAHRERFVKVGAGELMHVTDSVDDAMQYLRSAPIPLPRPAADLRTAAEA